MYPIRIHANNAGSQSILNTKHNQAYRVRALATTCVRAAGVSSLAVSSLVSQHSNNERWFGLGLRVAPLRLLGLSLNML